MCFEEIELANNTAADNFEAGGSLVKFLMVTSTGGSIATAAMSLSLHSVSTTLLVKRKHLIWMSGKIPSECAIYRSLLGGNLSFPRWHLRLQ
jgi:hypothetical protein